MKINIQKVTGLHSQGNTCFLNSALQLFLSASTLCLYILLNVDNDNLKPYKDTLIEYFNSEGNPSMVPVSIRRRFMELYKGYNGFSQEDAHEFLLYILDDIHETILKMKDSSLLNHLKSLFIVDIKCFENITGEPILSLPIDDNCKNLDDCLNLYLNGSIKYELQTFPKYIFIHLKRWTDKNNKRINKINVPFETLIFDGSTTYKLKSFVLHFGSTSGGHYVAYSCKNVDGVPTWFCCNDGNISLASDFEEQSKYSYMLLYSKK